MNDNRNRPRKIRTCEQCALTSEDGPIYWIDTHEFCPEHRAEYINEIEWRAYEQANDL